MTALSQAGVIILGESFQLGLDGVKADDLERFLTQILKGKQEPF